MKKVAEEEGFEPPIPEGITVFEFDPFSDLNPRKSLPSNDF